MLIIYRLKDQKIDYRTKQNCFFWCLFRSSSTSEKLSLQWPWSELELRCLLLASGFPIFCGHIHSLSASDFEGALRCCSICLVSQQWRNDFQDVDRKKFDHSDIINLEVFPLPTLWGTPGHIRMPGPVSPRSNILIPTAGDREELSNGYN